MVIPKDLKRSARLFVLKRITIFILLLALLCGAATFAFSRTSGLPNRVSGRTDSFTVIIYLLCVLAAAWISGVPHKLIDRTFYGKIVKVDVKTTYDNSVSFKPTVENMYCKNTVYLTVETDAGKQIRQKVREGKARPRSGEDTYKAGDTVFHLYGSKYTVIIPEQAESPISCPVCGTVNDHLAAACRACRHTLVR